MTPFVGLGRALGGRYRLVSPIAHGGTASVWEAEDSLLARSVAVKILDPTLAADPVLRERFRLEAIAAARLAHPNIVATFDTGEDDGISFIVMERVEGMTLRELLALAPSGLGVDRAGDIGAQIADALAHAHARGLVHRDIKPGNVLVQADGHAKVADFGIAKATTARPADLTAAGTVVGTARYLAPEQVVGAPADARADIYALGLVVLEMVTGRLPFTERTDSAAMVERLHTDVPDVRELAPDVPDPMARALTRALERDPAARLASAAELRDRLQTSRAAAAPASATAAWPVVDPPAMPTSTLVLEPPSLVTPAVGDGGGPPPRPARPRRRRALVALLVAGLAAAGVAAGLLVGPAARPPRSPGRRVALPSPRIVPIAAATDFDPLGDGREDHADVAKTIDGNEATSWSTDIYASRSFGNLKAGLGIVFDLSAPVALREVQVDALQAGWSAQVFVSSTDWTSAPSPQQVPAGAGADLPARATLSFPPTRGAHVLLWITELPPGGRLQIAEVRALG